MIKVLKIPKTYRFNTISTLARHRTVTSERPSLPTDSVAPSGASVQSALAVRRHAASRLFWAVRQAAGSRNCRWPL